MSNSENMESHDCDRRNEHHRRERHYISKKALKKKPISNRYICAWCERSVVYLYGGHGQGRITVCCRKCGKLSVIDLENGQSNCLT